MSIHRLLVLCRCTRTRIKSLDRQPRRHHDVSEQEQLAAEGNARADLLANP